MSVEVKEEMREQALLLRPITSRGELDVLGIAEAAKASGVRSSGWFPPKLMILVVILPMLAGILYNFVIASDRYVSTASFVVRENQGASAVMSLVEGGGLSRSDDSSFAIIEYIQSRDAVKLLNQDNFLRKIFGEGGVDLFSRFPTFIVGDTDEELYKHFQHYISADFNTSTGISTISVQAFAPGDANRLAEALLESAEKLVNKLNDRARTDAVVFTTELVDNATKRLHDVQQQLTEFRNTEKLISPDNEVQVSNRLMTDMLRLLGETNAQITQLQASAPNSPQVRQLLLRRDAVEKNIEALRQGMAGGQESLTRKIEGYEVIQIERQMAEKTLVNAITSMEAAELDARKGKLYLERVVQPNVPDKHSYPKRILNVILLFLICMATYWIITKTTELFSEDS